MTLRRYERYKDSGVEWLGAVPEHWEVMPLTRITLTKCDGPFGSGIKSDHYTDAGALVVRLQNIRAEGFFAGEPAFIDQAYFEQQLSGHEVLAGDVLIAGLGDDNNLVGRACVAPAGLGPSLVKADCFRFRIDTRRATPLFVATQLTAAARSDAGRLSTGSTRSRIPLSTMASRSICLPTLDEQNAIVRFLERENATIDTLIAEQQQLIELLTEKRQAVIAHAVTKGLNSTAPSRDSGVEGLGAVPAHWDVVRLKFIARVQTGIAKGKDNTGKQTVEVPYLRVANVQDGYLDLDDVATIELPADDLPRYRLQAGDVLMNEGGDFDKLGRGHVWDGSIDPCIHQNHVFAVRPFTISPRWLNAVTGSAYAQFYFMSRSKQSTNLASISSTNIMELPVVIPPAEEQQALLDWLDAQSTAFGRLIENAGNAVRLLRERRAALISAAVTGQIDVRNSASVESALAETHADIAAGRYLVESAAAHVARVQAMAAADEHSSAPPRSC